MSFLQDPIRNASWSYLMWEEIRWGVTTGGQESVGPPSAGCPSPFFVFLPLNFSF